MKKKQFKPINFKVRKQIEELALSLPEVPYVIKVNDKDNNEREVVQKILRTEVKGKQYLLYNQSRTMNHLVELRKAFQADGINGVNRYTDYVKKLYTNIQNSQ